MRYTSQKGQALVEILIGVVVGGILLTSALVLINVTLRVSRQNVFVQTATFLNQELLDTVQIFADAKWFCPDTPDCGIYNLPKGVANPYFVTNNSGSFIAQSGTEQIILGNVAYDRYFYSENVCRSNGGDITLEFVPPDTCPPGSLEDPSTQKITAITTWPEANNGLSISRYVTRSRNEVFQQTNWAGGAGQSGIWDDESKFESANNVEFSETPGSISIILP